MFTYSTICWQEATPTIIPSSEIYRQITEASNYSNLASLPIDDIADEFIRIYGRGERSPQRTGNNVEWRMSGAIHRAEITKYYFQYGLTEDPESTGCTPGVNFEFCEIFEIAGKFGCIVYFPSSDSTYSKPLGLEVRNPITLRNKETDNEQAENQQTQIAIQVPFATIESCRNLLRTESFAILHISEEKLQAETGLIFEDGVDDLDQYKSAVLKIRDVVFMLKGYQQVNNNLEIVAWHSTPLVDNPANLLRSALGLSEDELSND